MVECEICGEEFKRINDSHLQKHGISESEYKEKFPNSLLMEEEVREKYSKNARRILKNNSNFGFDKGKSNPGHNRSREHQEKLNQSIREGFENGREVWNKGETKETNEKVKEQAESLKNYERTEEHCKAISEAKKGNKIWGGSRPEAAKWAFKGSKHRPTYPKPYLVEKLNYKVRSSYEEEVGLILKENSIPHNYEGTTIEFDGKTVTFDFEIIKNKLYVETKGYFPDWQKKRYKKFRKIHPEITLIIVGGTNNPEDVCDIHLDWEEREGLPEILHSLISD